MPDLIVLDLQLPDGDGATVVDWLRSQSRLQQVPLVVYSAQELNEAEQARLALPQIHFFIKGRITPDGLAQRVLSILGPLVPRTQENVADRQPGEPHVCSVLN